MFLEKILLKNYRNLTDVFLEPCPGLNILTGFNGQGKTNFIEAIYLLATTSSHRTNLDNELINWQKDKALIQVLLNKKVEDLKISLFLDGNKKKAELNNTPLMKISDLIGNLNVVLFSPEDLQLVKGGPVFRREFLNVEVSQVSPYYHHLLQKYNHVLKQRNNLLKELREGKAKIDLLEIWDEELVKLGIKIIKKRIEVVDKIKILARLTQRRITNGSENLELSYEMSLGDNPFLPEDELKLIFKQKLANNRERELKRGYTLYGPHRDDLALKINDIDLRKYGSQGQQRTTALALKLAELEFMKSETGEYPILLLDDVFSELDELRRKTLLDILAEKIQTFITATELDNLTGLARDSYKVFRVLKGKITEER